MSGQATLRRELGDVEAYAALIGMLIGAGIFRVTSDAWRLTGPSVIFGYAALAPIVLATSIPYAVFLTTPLGREPGGEYSHIRATFRSPTLAFLGVWLKVISYVGALAYLAATFADYSAELFATPFGPGGHTAVASAVLIFFLAVHVFGVRWFGRFQVAMMILLAASIVVLVVPGLFAVRFEHYQPFFSGGTAGFVSALPLLFFAYAGFEALAQTAGEVRDSTSRLPRIFLWGIAATTVIYMSMSVVTFGVLPGRALTETDAPMAAVAAAYLPFGSDRFVSFGALCALATSINTTTLVPSRLGVMLARDRLVPAWFGHISPRTGTPIPGLTLTIAAALALLLTGQLGLALNIAVSALVTLYAVHGVALLALPRQAPDLYAQVRSPISRRLQVASAVASVAAMVAILVVQFTQDLATIAARTGSAASQLTALELMAGWTLLGLVLRRVGFLWLSRGEGPR